MPARRRTRPKISRLSRRRDIASRDRAIDRTGEVKAPVLVNRVEPTVLGMPFLLAWCVAWIVLSAGIMAIIFRFDPANRDDRS